MKIFSLESTRKIEAWSIFLGFCVNLILYKLSYPAQCFDMDCSGGSVDLGLPFKYLASNYNSPNYPSTLDIIFQELLKFKNSFILDSLFWIIIVFLVLLLLRFLKNKNANSVTQQTKKWYQYNGILAIIILAIITAFSVWVYWQSTASQRETQSFINHTNQEVVVIFKSSTDSSHVKSLAQQLSGTFESYTDGLNMGVIYIPDKTKVDQAIKFLQQQQDVSSAERNSVGYYLIQ